MRRCLTLIAGALLAGCHHSARTDTAELALAAAASESLTVALTDSIAPAQGLLANQAGAAIEGLSACSDHVSAAGWQSVGSSLVEMELPPEFVSAGQTSQSVSWNGPSGSIRAASYRGDSPHVGIYGTITSECDIFISGAPAHVDLVSSYYGRSVHVIVRPQDAPAMIIEGQAKTIAGQAQLLHAIRYARVSAAWGRKY